MTPLRLYLFAATLLWSLALSSAVSVEPRTGIEFEDKLNRAKLEKVGLRSKGPIKVYAVGQYGKSIFVLKMAYSVNAEKLSGALMDALKPRCEELGCGDQVEEFKAFVMDALPNGAKQGTQLVFNTAGGKVTLSVNGKPASKISGKAVAKAFTGIYTDANAVCKMKPVQTDDSGERDPEMMATLGVMAATTLVIFLLVTKPDPAIKVSELNIYPVKSCAEQSVSEATVTPRGFAGDRIAMVVDANGKCCTSRDKDKAKLFHIHADLDVDNDNLTLTAASAYYPLEVDLQKSAPSGKVTHNEAPGEMQLADYGNVAAAWLEIATGIAGCRLTGIGEDYQRKVMVNASQGDAVPNNGDAPVSLADEAPFLLTNEASLDDLNSRMVARGKSPVDMRRFRPNIVVSSGSGLSAWEEDTWSKIRIGGTVEFFVWQRCGRCTMTTIDRDTLDRSGEPLATLNTFRESVKGQRNFGMHLVPDPSTLVDGKAEIHAGDKIEVLEYNKARQTEWQENKDNGGMAPTE
ncbi:amidoxime reducing component 2 [Seminavis robusta]|uniref:Amidoxime reducing component 2 n=1 Tax=Seminavis robusta TaxID=568900 RepID=A0A9N8DA46_9STRA|nr:amidoxime reducing component 2 [Seminavis robusta]|eukprot:Sro12_g009550.1 amidoxime reducing component 2 (518) ;mRNA; f:149723-151276